MAQDPQALHNIEIEEDFFWKKPTTIGIQKVKTFLS